jgi:hypothetical protein
MDCTGNLGTLVPFDLYRQGFGARPLVHHEQPVNETGICDSQTRQFWEDLVHSPEACVF